MPKKKLRETLEELRRELEDSETLDQPSRRLLEGAMEDILERLGGDRPPEPHSLGDDLREAVRGFELSHPTLAGVIGRTIDLLAQSGI